MSMIDWLDAANLTWLRAAQEATGYSTVHDGQQYRIGSTSRLTNRHDAPPV